VRVKRYIVDSMPEAMEKIRADLGQDAVILSSKTFKAGGLFGLFGKQRIEVIAAVDEKAAVRSNPETARMEVQPEASRLASAGTYTAKQVYRRPAAIGERGRTAAQSQPVQQPVQESVTPPFATSVRENGTAFAGPEVLTKMREQKPAETSPGSEQLVNEVRDMRKMVEKLLIHDPGQRLPESLQAVRNRLLEQEVEEELSAEIIRQLMEAAEPGHDMSVEEALRFSQEKIAAMMKPSIPSTIGLGPEVRYAFFFGPTGVGKTTTIAKLAANSMLKERRKIGFITADTYRMAAVEQLKTYANILNVPLEVVFSPQEMVQAMEKLRDRDLIFVDTAGRNFRNQEYVKGIRELVQYGNNSINYLVLSLTSKYKDMKAILENFAEVPVGQVIFTKADETKSYGSILNVSRRTGLALSYITTGQNVPDDIMEATPALVSSMIMGD